MTQNTKRMMSTMFVARPFLVALTVVCSPVFSPAHLGQSPEPNQPAPYIERNISYINPAGGAVLGGSFTRPEKGGPYPAVLLIPGSGRQNRDEAFAGHRPFRDLAAYLTHHGIAVLRADRRGVGASTGDFAKATTQDFASDAEAGVRYLLARPDVDSKHVGMIGHGEGAIIASMAAAKVPQVSFLVLLAAPALPGEQILLTQRERAERASHMPPAEMKADLQIATMLFDLVKQGKSLKDLERSLNKDKSAPDDVADRWLNQLPSLGAPWLRFFLTYDPGPNLEKIKCPVLALAGEKDMDVLPDQNVPALKAAFARGQNPDATVDVLPGLNYFFQTADTGLPIEYPTLPESISPIALETITGWITSHTS